MLQKVVISRSRWNTITTHKLLKDFTLIVPESEKQEYSDRIKNCEIKTIPDDIVGLGKIRNYCIDLYKGKDIMIFDDDIREFLNLTRERPLRISEPDTVQELIDNLYNMALDMDVKIFGFSQKADVRKYMANQPFSLTSTYIGCAVGIIANELRFTEQNKFKVDVDYTLQQLMHHRIILLDERFSVSQIRDTNRGGNSKYRTKESTILEMEYLEEKWGKYLKIGQTKNKEQTRVKVPRTQQLSI